MRLSWLPMAALAGVLASILALLYVRTRGYDASSYYENIVLLRQLQQLDARWELDTLKSRMGIEANYDSLVDPLVGLNESWDRLRAILTRQGSSTADPLARAGDAYHRAVQAKTRLVEHFKSHNSVLRNSLAFLPTAADDVQKAIDRTRGPGNSAFARLPAAVNAALLDSMIFSQAPSDDKATDIRRDLAQLAETTRNTPPELNDALEIFAAHVRTVLREQPEVNSLLNGIVGMPVAARLDELHNLLSNARRQDELQIQQYRRYLLIFAAALAALLLYLAVKLIRSHAVIQQVNRELAATNETLEQRVQERTRELQEAQSDLIRTARRAGMAEIATNVLHNVGNVLNSVNVSAGLITDRIKKSKAVRLADAVQLLSEHAADLGNFLTHDERGKRFPDYLKQTVAALASERSCVIEELVSLTKGVDHIRDIVATQQSHAGPRCLAEPVQVGDLIEDSLRMNADSVARHRVTVIKDWPDVPEVLLDKHLMLQILVNLIANALQAMDSVTDRPLRLNLRAEALNSSAGSRLRIHVEDNGEGIDPDNLPRLFAHGFTTRKNGHGFGLHSCALAARAMDGRLTAHSAGPGSGATFTLEMPLQQPPQKAIVNM